MLSCLTCDACQSLTLYFKVVIALHPPLVNSCSVVQVPLGSQAERSVFLPFYSHDELDISPRKAFPSRSMYKRWEGWLDGIERLQRVENRLAVSKDLDTAAFSFDLEIVTRKPPLFEEMALVGQGCGLFASRPSRGPDINSVIRGLRELLSGANILPTTTKGELEQKFAEAKASLESVIQVTSFIVLHSVSLIISHCVERSAP